MPDRVEILVDALHNPRARGPQRHHCWAEEQENCPGAFEVNCTCGGQTWTPWGTEHVEEIVERHMRHMHGPRHKLFVMGK